MPATSTNALPSFLRDALGLAGSFASFAVGICADVTASHLCASASSSSTVMTVDYLAMVEHGTFDGYLITRVAHCASPIEKTANLLEHEFVVLEAKHEDGQTRYFSLEKVSCIHQLSLTLTLTLTLGGGGRLEAAVPWRRRVARWLAQGVQGGGGARDGVGSRDARAGALAGEAGRDEDAGARGRAAAAARAAGAGGQRAAGRACAGRAGAGHGAGGCAGRGARGGGAIGELSW